jgi:hypothetical protein
MMMATCLTTASKSTTKSMENRKNRENVVGTLDAKVIGGVDLAVETLNAQLELKKGGTTYKTFSGVVDQGTGYSAKSYRSYDSVSDPMPGADETVTPVTNPGDTTTTETSTEPTTITPPDLSGSANIKTWAEIGEQVDRINYGGGAKQTHYRITESSVFMEPLYLSADSSGPCIYIDPPANTNIDIVLSQPVEIGKGSGIFVNDNNGTSRIRIFLTDNGSLKLSGYGDSLGIYPIKDNGNFDISQCVSSLHDGQVDMSKKLNMYLFTTGNQTIEIDNAAYFPGYIVAPSATLNTSVNHEYKKDQSLEKDENGKFSLSYSSYPVVNGMIVCKKYVDSSNMNAGYFVLYNPPAKSDYMEALSDCFVYNN